jgi:hypothetical protein
VNTLAEQLKETMIELAKCKAVLKLVGDRANFAIEYAESADGYPGVPSGLIAQFAAIKEDVKPCLD